MAWDRADGKCARSPALSYSDSYNSWRICRLDGHLAYDVTSALHYFFFFFFSFFCSAFQPDVELTGPAFVAATYVQRMRS